MKYINLKVVFIILSICVSKHSMAQGQFTNMGKDFLLAFYSNNSNAANNAGLFLELKIVAPKATNVKITYLIDNTVENYSIPENTVFSYELDAIKKAKIYPNTNSTPQRTTMRIETDNGVTIYAINMFANTTDGTTVLPINNYGSSYLNVGVPGSTAVVIATEDDTKIRINGTLQSFTLKKFESVAVGSIGQKISAENSLGIPTDIAVFTVHRCSNWPNGACDHQWEQLVPISNFGKEFFIPRTLMRYERVVIVGEQPTTITYQIGTGSMQTATVTPGAATDIQFDSDMRLSANNPVAITTHIGGTQTIPASENEDGANVTGGDPSTAWVPPIEQDITSAYITPFKGGNTVIKAHYALIVTKTENKAFTTVNGVAPIGAANTLGWRDHTSGYSSIIIHLPQQVAYTILNPKGMIVLAYGVGGSESYSYLAASSARKLDAAFYITNNGERYHYQDADLSVPFDCGSPFTFDAEIQYNLQTSPGHIKWYVDGVEEISAVDQLSWMQPYLSGGNHTVKLVITDEYGEVEELETTLNVECATDMAPKTTAIYEGDTQEMTITLSGIAPTNIVFNLSAHTGTTAQASDYSFPATATIAAGSDEVKFNVVAQPDNIINEPDELLVLRAYNSEYGELFSNITIKDKSTTAQKTLTLSASPAAVNEPHTGYTTTPNTTVLTLSLPPSITTDTIVRVGLVYAGTAIMDTDYTLSTTAAKTYIEIPRGGSSASFTLTAKEDNLYEGPETVVITPTAPAGHSMSAASVTVTINDRTPSAIVVATILDAEESATASVTGKFRIRFSKTEVTTKKPITVVYKLTGTANDGTAYDLINPTEAIIPLDQSYVDVEVKPKNNFVVEGARKVNIELLSVTD